MTDKKYILIDKEIKEAATLMEWVEWYENPENRRIAQIKIKAKGIRISTVFLGLDHSFDGGPPLLFETMIFGGEHDGYCERYVTYEEAEIGHQKAVKICGGQGINW